MSEIFVRPASASDIPQIAALMGELGYPVSEPEMAARLERLETLPDHYTLVAVADGNVAGVIGFAKAWFWERSGCFVRIQALVTGEAYYGRGIARLLIASCEAWAREQGALCLQLNCGNKEARRNAHIFYPKAGFTHTSSGYVKHLDA
jgi:GNAT superfamily N-acetyltransferase